VVEAVVGVGTAGVPQRHAADRVTHVRAVVEVHPAADLALRDVEAEPRALVPVRVIARVVEQVVLHADRHAGPPSFQATVASAARSSTWTNPVEPSTRMRSPVRMQCRASLVSITHGMPISRDRIAAWLNGAPMSTTTPPATRK